MTNTPHDNDKQLLLDIANGDEFAFEQFYNLHWNRIYSLALAYLKSPEQAQDIVQETFLKLWNKRELLKKVENPESFLYIMGRNEVIRALKKKISIAPLDEEKNDLPDDLLLSQPPLEAKQLQEQITSAIDTLPAQQKLIFKLSREEGLNHEQIAQRLGIERTTVKNHIVRALSSLRRILQLDKNNLLFWYLLAEWFKNR